ncbi:chromosome segregation protein SMC [Methylobacterium sp. Leaf104]|uniref:YhaN family protein n=1 Tax=Methylobacterium TaxID=407 RepID=UPI0006F2337C|nr:MULTISPECIES: YhaN family protein [Methylobacterium]KQP37628.1 chromosome segregation protein SMC [Methylobacterium sp. Leaf104]MCI9881404.1 AAA family ATPase [Methylobacterium goesingense]
MRLLSLALERYGPFTGRTVTFREDARLHVVLGANEAGKSSALSAVTDLLFGIETRTRYDFLHDMPQMRIGAEIRAADGRRLGFRRRKGNRNTLVDAADGPLPEDALAPFLGGLSREVFCRAFGLDARALRAGAAEMMDAEGEVGASLFAAASGLRGYSGLQAELEGEAADIFMPRAAQSRTFYQALGRYDEARKAIRAGELRAGDWRDLNGEIEAAGAALAALKAERGRIAAEQARLTRLRRVGPLLQAIDAAAARAEAEPDLIAVPEAWIDRLGQALAALRTTAEAAARTQAAAAEAALVLEQVPVDEGVLARADEILEAFRGTDRFDKGGIDLPRIQGEADAFARELAQLAARIGLPDAEALRARQPSDAARARIEGLIRAGREGAATIARLRQDRAARQAERDRLAAAMDEAGALADPAPLRADLKAFAGLRRDLDRRDDLDAALTREAASIRAQAGRLSPPILDLDAYTAGRPPSAEAVARYRRTLDGALRERDRAADRLAAARSAVARRRARLEARAAGRPIPSLADLLDLRARRDALLADLPGGAPDALARFGAALAAADRAADDLVSDAARVAEQGADTRSLAAEQAEAAAADEALAACETRLAEGAAAWRAAWAPCGIDPAAPAEMAAWLTEVETLQDAAQGLETTRLEQARMAARAEACRAPLADLSRRAGLPDLAGLDLGRMLARLEDRVAELALRWETVREAKTRAETAAEQIARTEAALAEALAREAAWRGAWEAAIADLGLMGAASTDEAEAALAAWRAVPAALSERDNRLGRVNGIARDIEVYRGAVARLTGAVAPDLAALPPTAAMKALHTRLQNALKGESRRAELARQRDAAEAARAQAARAAQAAGADLAALMGEGAAALPAGTDPETLHARLTARRACQAELAERRAELARAADGLAEADLRADLAALTGDDIEGRLANLAAEEEDLDQRGKLAFADRDRHERRRAELEGGIGAELALAQRKAAEAELQANARHWAVLKLAGLMLGTAIGRHRAGQQDPLLARSGALFGALTGGAFAGLAQDYDAADTPRLAGRRATGALVPVEGLSEGTRDQLYLALRLAYLEDYAARAEPAPFIGDDLFLTFDDARTAHGLEALAAVGDTIQPILFTHHRHVADLARARLGNVVDVLDL